VEVEDGEEAEQHPGRLPFKDVLLPPQWTTLPLRTANPRLLLLPFTLDVSGGGGLGFGGGIPCTLGFGRIPQLLLIGGGR
jgi:hypothetical protein